MVSMKKVLIADDHALFREGLKQFIARTADMVVTDEVDTGQEVLGRVQARDYDLLILDISMPGRNGLEILVEVKKMRPKLPVLILSMHPEGHYAQRALKAGASGYLTKGSPCAELTAALKQIAMGRRYISASLAETLADSLACGTSGPLHDSLSNRECQIMCLIVSGRKPQQIAGELAMSVKTVGTYRARIFKKLKIKSNAELTRYVIENEMM